MLSYARWWFGISAVFNFAIGVSLLFLRPLVSPSLGLDPVAGTNLVLVNFAGALVTLFGYAYLRIALDPGRYRVLIPFTATGKILAASSGWVPWLMGEIPLRLPMIMSADLVFALLFFDFLRRFPTPRAGAE
jgi:hypothetical protein